MCIIAISPKNVPIPSAERRAEMFCSNPDGAGFMYPYRGRVRIEKGFMKLRDMEKRLAEVGKTIDLTATPIVFHYRIGTHGGNIPQNTHPFPVTSNRHSLLQTTIDSWLGCVHNGVIHTVRPRKGYSDTQEYIATRIARFRHNFIHDKKKLGIIEAETMSKLAFLAPDGEIVTVGDFIHADDGCMYSNGSYNPYRWYSVGKKSAYKSTPIAKPYSWGDDYYSLCEQGYYDGSDGWSSSLLDTYADAEPCQSYEAEVYTLDECVVADGNGDLHDGSEYCSDQYGRLYRYNVDGTATLDSRARIISYSGAGRNPYCDWAYDEYDPDDWAEITCIGKKDAPWHE